ncbi:MAG: orotate phosphoribosyltransferase [Clostridiales bacterium]|jgi:orotate phosphoribosyltransferase|nr:orotate phosphoribosyltransferase [Clostridiales bacterium]
MKNVKNILVEVGALLEGHFVLTSGRHAAQYMQCAKILQWPEHTEDIAEDLAEAFEDDDVDLVVSPAVGAIVLGYELARHLDCRAIFCEREQGKMTLRRGFEIPRGARVLVCEDVVTTGGSVREVMEVVRAAGGEVVGIALLVDRSGGAVDFGVKKVAAYTTAIESYEPGDCPLCKENKLPAIKPGSRSN